MFFTATNLVHYLLLRELVDIKDVVDGNFKVLEAGQRNRNFRVIGKNGLGLFVKQVQTLTPMNISTMRRETDYYRFAQIHSDGFAFMPRFLHHDTVRHGLVIELIANGENLSEYYSRHGKLSPQIAHLLGGALGACHRSLSEKHSSLELSSIFPKAVPWILSFQEAPPNVTGGVIQFIEFLNNHTDLTRSMNRLRQEWKFDGVIHGDMKWENCMLFPDGEGSPQLKIVDWELVDIGDAAWDIGGIFHSYLSRWALTTSLNKDDLVKQILRKDNARTEAMLHEMREFLSGYLAVVGIELALVAAFLLRCVEFTAARLILAAFEILVHANKMTDHAEVLLLLSEQIFHAPQEIVKDLFCFNECGAL